MATARLIPSTYYLSSTSYLSVSNAANMYANTDSDTYGTVTNSQTGTSSYYIYLRGFNFDDIPSGAIVNSFSVKFKARESGVSTSSSYRPYMCNNTSTITGTCSAVSTTATTQTFSGVTADWDTIKGYGSNFGIRFNCRRASRNTTAYMYLYGAEIEVDYTIPNPRTVTTSVTGSGTIDPSGTDTYYDGDEFELVIEPTNENDTVTATQNGTDITSQLVRHAGGSHSEQNMLGEYTLISGGFNGQGASYFQGIVGNGYDATQTTSNYYSSGSGTQAVFQYDVSFADIPADVTITRLYMMANGHAESTSNSSEYMCVQLKSGSTELSEEYNFKSSGSTSNSTQTIEATTLPTVAQLESLVVECTLGYYGGAINGVTVFLEYTVSGVYYTYATTISGDMTIAVTIGSAAKDTMYVKVSGSWVEATAVYKKVNGVWVEQTDLTTIFDSGTNYVRGGV